jgi:hypothetical protein
MIIIVFGYIYIFIKLFKRILIFKPFYSQPIILLILKEILNSKTSKSRLLETFITQFLLHYFILVKYLTPVL